MRGSHCLETLERDLTLLRVGYLEKALERPVLMLVRLLGTHLREHVYWALLEVNTK